MITVLRYFAVHIKGRIVRPFSKGLRMLVYLDGEPFFFFWFAGIRNKMQNVTNEVQNPGQRMVYPIVSQQPCTVVKIPSGVDKACAWLECSSRNSRSTLLRLVCGRVWYVSVSMFRSSGAVYCICYQFLSLFQKFHLIRCLNGRSR